MNFNNAFIYDPSDKSKLCPIRLEGHTLDGLPVFGNADRLPDWCYFDETFLRYRWKYGCELFKKLML